MALTGNFLFSSEIQVAGLSCRLCLKTFKENETKIAIDDEFRQQFFEMTQNELDASELFPQVVCKNCLAILNNMIAWKTQFIENQKILEDALIFENTIADESLMLNVSYLDALCSRIDEEHLEEESETEVMIQEFSSDINLNQQTRKYTKLCSECGKTFSSQSYKKLHFERVHLRLKNYNCDYCTYSSYTKKDMEIHVQSHFKIRNYFCGQCGEAFGSGNNLKQHFLTHTVERPFICEETTCSLAFKSAFALNRHKKTHSLDKRKVSCDFCSASFADNWHLQRHKKSHKIQSFACLHCDKIFGTDERLKAHQIYHKPPKYRCDECQKEFFKRQSFEAHQKTHTGQRDFNCSICPSKFYKRDNLTRHMKAHAKSEGFEFEK